MPGGRTGKGEDRTRKRTRKETSWQWKSILRLWCRKYEGLPRVWANGMFQNAAASKIVDWFRKWLGCKSGDQLSMLSLLPRM
eukprot:365104-Chlamydomonas_euryale.AAC.4